MQNSSNGTVRPAANDAYFVALFTLLPLLLSEAVLRDSSKERREPGMFATDASSSMPYLIPKPVN